MLQSKVDAKPNGQAVHSGCFTGHAMRYFVTINTLNDDDEADERTMAART